MRKVRKKNILNRIDDSINDKIDEIKRNTQEKKENKFNEKKIEKSKKVTIDEDKKKTLNDKKESNKKNNNYNSKNKSNKKKIEKEENKIFDYDDELDNKITDIAFDEVHDQDEDLLKVDKIEESDSEKTKEKKIFKFGFKKKEKNINENKLTKKERKNNKAKNNKSTEKELKPKKKKRSLWKKIVTFILIMCILGVLSVTGFLAYIVATAPEFNEADLAIKDQTVIYDVYGNVIAKLGIEKRESISYNDAPQVLIDAIIATEDSRFFQHNGVDLFRFIKATIQQLLGQDSAGGASTLTMQTVKNNLTKKDSVEKDDTIEEKIKKVVRKFQDVYLAVFKVEKEYSKEEILEMYMNDNGLGSSYYGVEEASKYYFGKSASDLTLPEASLIAGLFQAPNRHNPYRDIESATNRRNTVLDLMERHGYITKEEKELAKSIPIESLLVGSASSQNPYQGYIDAVIDEVEKITDHGDGTGGDNPYTVPMKIYTAMDTHMQDGINAVFASIDASIWRDDKVQGGVAIVDVGTGEIAALGAGRNREGERKFNYATQAYRQPGSTSKPIFDYGPGIEFNNFSSYQLFNDEPWSYTNGPSIGNWDGQFNGLITARYALQFSRNIPALKAFQQVGPKNSQQFAYSLGLDVALNTSSENYKVYNTGIDNTINEAYSIGGVAKGFTPLEMASAYACFANGGYHIEPHTVNKIVYRETNEEKEFKYTKERVMKDSTAYIMNNILESAVTGGFDGGARVIGSHVAAKTGTSNYDTATMLAKGLPGYAINDLWTVAYTSKYSIGLWYGYEEIDPEYFNYEDGKKNQLMRAIMVYIPNDTVGWAMPSSVVPATVERETWPAMLPSQYTPSDMVITEYFVRGTQPTEVSPRYQKLNDIKNVSNTKVTSNSVNIKWDYDTPTALSDSYLQSYFDNSVYGNQKASYLARRKDYNSNVLGDVKFYIYRKADNGSLVLEGVTSDKSYTYNGFGNTTLVIKAEHANFKNNASDGVTINIKLDELSNDKLEVTLKGNSSVSTNVGTYIEEGIKSVTYSNNDITNNSSVGIKYIVAINNDTHNFDKKEDLEEYVNTLTAGTYKINYVVSYLGISVTKTRTVRLR